jgi:hypothetical protein
MFNQGGRGGGFRNRINNIAQRFRQAGALSPDTAKTPEEIGLPPQFDQAMHRRLGQTGIFIEVSGKYYLDENRLAQFNQSGFGWQQQPGTGQRWGGGGRNYQTRQSLLTLRIIRITLSIIVLLLIIGNFFYFHSFNVWFAVIFLFILTVVISVLQIFYLSRLRRSRNF